jgi:hypothetical protein
MNSPRRYPERDQIAGALPPMQVAINALRVQVCRRCDDGGYDPHPPVPGPGECRHPEVPIYDLRTGQPWVRVSPPPSGPPASTPAATTGAAPPARTSLDAPTTDCRGASPEPSWSRMCR